MSNKTELFQMHFFLVSKNKTISVKQKMTIGRSEGDVVIADPKLSAKHCEITPKGLNLFIKDLNSTNGVYVNKLLIPSNKEVRLNLGDIVRLGNEEFTFQENDSAPKPSASASASGFVERRANPGSPVNPITAKIGELLSFFATSKEWKGLYLLLMILTAVSWLMNMELKAPLPFEMTFLSELHSKLIISNGIRNILIVWALCLLHAYIISVYVKSNLWRVMTLVPLFALILNIVNFVDGPAWFLKNYVEERHTMLEMEKRKTAIVDLKRMVAAKISFQNGYIKINPLLLEEELVLLKKDYELVIKNINKKIDSLKPRPDRR